ncbi:uncharacterized protein LOC110232982 [Exaiptasia diaphana]|uniref:Mab-21-like HhH/H2TH-like domain-containing protein n=1 Tax=Exaiptasia diaphana TaxID=2652724 RepID=A0A913WTI5_EXADI|nr:uncharacterized protein LOC110232982 [Exaiptasia diaphana]KXJ18064.1 Protein mab-21-like 3 [Exaiptasia diaphana]
MPRNFFPKFPDSIKSMKRRIYFICGTIIALPFVSEAIQTVEKYGLSFNAFWFLLPAFIRFILIQAVVFIFLKYLPYIDFVMGTSFKQFMARVFPYACGHRRHLVKFFYLSSGKLLKEILDEIMYKVFPPPPPNEECQQSSSKAISFFNIIAKQLGKVNNTCIFSHFFTGSISEGYAIPFLQREKIPNQFNGLCSDFDVMICCDSYRASFSQKGNTYIKSLSNIGQFDEPLLPVYCQLHFQDPDKGGKLLDFNELLKNLESAVETSSIRDLDIKFMDSLMTRTSNNHGPSFRIKIGPLGNEVFEGDITLCVKCEEWPPLSNWTSHTDRWWPSEDKVRNIFSNGFHLVALPQDSNKYGKCTWRYSFSMAEVELSKLVPSTARKCFLALKIIHKDHLKPILPELSSYHIKTIFLNTLEKTEEPERFWVDYNIDNCFQTLLQELHYCLTTGHCNHYWVDGVNLFDEIPEKKRKHLLTLADKVNNIKRNPCLYVEDIGLYGYMKIMIKKIGYMRILILIVSFFKFCKFASVLYDEGL